MKGYNVAIVGATGLVGPECIKILEQRKPIPEVLQHRLGPRPPGTPQPVTSFDHWMDGLVDAVHHNGVIRA